MGRSRRSGIALEDLVPGSRRSFTLGPCSVRTRGSPAIRMRDAMPSRPDVATHSVLSSNLQSGAIPCGMEVDYRRFIMH